MNVPVDACPPGPVYPSNNIDLSYSHVLVFFLFVIRGSGEVMDVGVDSRDGENERARAKDLRASW